MKYKEEEKNMEQNKVIIFEQFARKAKERIEERKRLHTEILEIDSMDGMSMEIRGLSDAELNEVYEFSEDAIENDKYAIFFASTTLQEAAKIMVADGSLKQGREYHITDMFTQAERRFIANRILVLSGVNSEAGIRIKETDEVKNS